MNDKVKIENGMPLPDDLDTKFEEVLSRSEALSWLIEVLLEKVEVNRARVNRLWREIEETFDLDNKRWRVSKSPRTHLKHVFEEMDSHGVSLKEEGED